MNQDSTTQPQPDPEPGADDHAPRAPTPRVESHAPPPASLGSRIGAGLTGVLAGGLALAIAELVAAFGAPRPGPVISVANRVIKHAPVWFIDLGKTLFSLNDKPALIIGTLVICLVASALIGVAAQRRLIAGMAGIAGFGLVGLAAMATDPQGGIGLAAAAMVAAVGAGSGVLWLLTSKIGAPQTLAADLTPSPTNPPVSRRGFITAAGTVGVAGVTSIVAARVIRDRATVADARDAVRLRPPAETGAVTTPGPGGAGSVEAGSSGLGQVAATPGITPLVVPNDDFYLIDTAVLVPQIDPSDWSLTIDGMVDNPITITHQELVDRATTQEAVTLSCVSNEVGGTLVGNAIWQGVPLTELLDEAGVNPEASQIASWSVDNWSCGFPTDLAYDGRVALVAVGMNGEPLPIKHGFPARLVVSGLYGYVSATKWLQRIELTTLEAFDGFWIPRGWSKLGPVKIQSRIDTPRRGQSVEAGTPVPVAGVAWAPSVGVSSVEVKIDDEPWVEADLGDSLGIHAWRQWRLSWTPSPGRHTIMVRATNEDGTTQTSALSPPAPNGATGWHTIEVNAA